MTDTVRCSVDTSQGHHTVNCEVDIGPEPSAASASTPASPTPAAPAAPAAPVVTPAAPPSPAVTALVNKFVVSRHEVHAPKVDAVTTGSAQMCLGQLTAVPVLLMGLKGAPVAAVAGFKIGYDLGACLGKDSSARQLSADEAAAVAQCQADGGAATGFVEHALMCRVPTAVSP